MFLFLFLPFHSCSSFFPVPLFLSSPLLLLLSVFLPFSGRLHKMTHKGWRVIKPQHNQSVSYFLRKQDLATCLFLFLHCPSLSSPLLSLLSVFSLSLGDDTKWPTRVDMSLNHNTVSQFYIFLESRIWHFIQIVNLLSRRQFAWNVKSCFVG